MAEPTKIALVLHGWPQPRTPGHILFTYLQKDGYEVICPSYIFGTKEKLDKENVIKTIKNSLGDKHPDLIIGMSMGGLILPWIALDYPDAILVFVATGSQLKPKSKMFNFLTSVISLRIGRFVAKLLLLLPENVIVFAYKVINPNNVRNYSDKSSYFQDMKGNIKNIKNMPLNKHLEALDLVKNVSNKEVLSNLTNKTIIVCGDSDKLMPKDASLELNNLIKNSKLIVTRAGHFNVLNEETVPKLLDLINELKSSVIGANPRLHRNGH